MKSSFFFFLKIFPKADVQRCFVKNVLLKSSQNSLENTCARVSGTGIFLWILQKFKEHPILQKTSVAAFIFSINLDGYDIGNLSFKKNTAVITVYWKSCHIACSQHCFRPAVPFEKVSIVASLSSDYKNLFF